MKKRMKVDWFPYLMALPALILVGVICVYPLLEGIYLSFTVTKLITPDVMRFVGLDNYVRLIGDDRFWNSLSFTVVYTLASTILAYLFGLVVALLMNRKMRFQNVVRALLLITWVLPAVVGTTSWQWTLHDEMGVVNEVLETLGLIEKPILFFADPFLAKITVIIFCVWKTYPFMALVILASLQSINTDMFEAAMIDGAGSISRLRYITMPLIRRESLLAIVLMIMWNFNRMDFIYLMTEGGPMYSTEVMAIYSYFTAFFRGSLGYASTISVALMLIMTVILIVYFNLKKREVEE